VSEQSRESDRANREMARAAKEMAKAAGEMSRAHEQLVRDSARMREYERLIDELQEVLALSEGFRRHLNLLESAPELPEVEAALIADKSVHSVRKSIAQEGHDSPKAPPPTAEEIREWERRREDRHKREAS
jgi:hypothetical protein